MCDIDNDNDNGNDDDNNDDDDDDDDSVWTDLALIIIKQYKIGSIL